MRREIVRRLRWSGPDDAVVDPRVDRAVMARLGIYLFASGAAIGAVALATSSDGFQRPVAVAGAVIGAAVGCLILLIRFDDLARPAFGCAAAAATALVTLASWGVGDPTTPVWTLYLGVVFYCVYFFSRSVAGAYIGAIVAATGSFALAVDQAPGAWLFSGAMLAGSALLVLLLKERVQALIERLDALARTDALTGLLNRRGFEERLAAEIERSNRYGHEMAVLIGDLDRFKDLNDFSGHAVGDAALERVARVLRRSMRDPDSAARLGGDEFVVIAPETSTVHGVELAERLKGAVAAEFSGDRVPVTISFGIAALPGDGRTFEELYRASDEALYRAKRLPLTMTGRVAPLQLTGSRDL